VWQLLGTDCTTTDHQLPVSVIVSRAVSLVVIGLIAVYTISFHTKKSVKLEEGPLCPLAARPMKTVEFSWTIADRYMVQLVHLNHKNYYPHQANFLG
jgi:hypothetical protein